MIATQQSQPEANKYAYMLMQNDSAEMFKEESELLSPDNRSKILDDQSSNATIEKIKKQVAKKNSRSLLQKNSVDVVYPLQNDFNKMQFLNGKTFGKRRVTMDLLTNTTH